MKCFLVGGHKDLLDSVETYLQTNFFYISICAKSAYDANTQKMIDLSEPNLIIFDVDINTEIPLEIYRKVKSASIDMLAMIPKDQNIMDYLNKKDIAYITKPIDHSALRFYINTVYSKRSKEEELQQILTRIRNTNPKKRIAIPQEKEIQMISTNDILYIEADINYCLVYLREKKTICVSKTLKSFEQQLCNNHEFYRIHQSYLINLNHINKVTKTKLPQVSMINGDILTISRSKKTAFLKLILN
ncbi:LytTR family DNA-binding domain-containing protein [Aquimarina pacifica]|uniref:LytTR family DNA-binding domain-containing protein n=1 Tax=Aquimarina pacifica TaxID=1296415 RepID=UPI00046ECA5D|nr:LytTR family DNA-binding domain-containing protein [Aquimarina pacifica]